jgi:hypothetical protein
LRRARALEDCRQRSARLERTVFLAGDSSYTLGAMLSGAVDGVGADEEAARLTHERIRAYTEANPRLPR